jgi:hypothetical protein
MPSPVDRTMQIRSSIAVYRLYHEHYTRGGSPTGARCAEGRAKPRRIPANAGLAADGASHSTVPPRPPH